MSDEVPDAAMVELGVLIEEGGIEFKATELLGPTLVVRLLRERSAAEAEERDEDAVEGVTDWVSHAPVILLSPSNETCVPILKLSNAPLSFTWTVMLSLVSARNSVIL
jgi:hypothetical protein